MKYILLLTIFFLSCKNSSGEENNGVKIAIQNLGSKQYTYLIVEKSHITTRNSEINISNLVSSLGDFFSFTGINYGNTSPLTEQVTVKFNNSNETKYLLIFKNLSIYDSFKLTMNTSEIVLKEENLFSVTKSIESNKINVLDSLNLIFIKASDISNASIIIEEKPTELKFNNSKLENIFFNSKGITGFFKFTFDAMEIEKSAFYRFENSIEILGTSKIKSSLFSSKESQGYLLNIQNSDLTMTQSIAYNVNEFLNVTNSNLGMSHMYFNENNYTFKSTTNSTINLERSFASNIINFGLLSDGASTIDNLISEEVTGILFELNNQEFTMKNSDISTSQSSRLIYIRKDNVNSSFVDSIYINKNNFEVASSSKELLYIGERMNTQMICDSNYMKFPSTDIDSWIFDKTRATDHLKPITGEVIFRNELSSKNEVSIH